MKTFNLLLAFVSATAVLAQTSTQRDAAISHGDWTAVLANGGNDPASRFLHAHALLVHGTSDEAFCGFAGLQTSWDIAAWDSWTREFAARQPTSATANYLRGDALARTANWTSAASAFDKALVLDRRYVLALNARGIVRTILGQYDAGLLDFESATTINRAFADAHINRGYLYVQRKSSAASALRSFESALVLNRGAALAVLGRGQSLVMQGRSVGGVGEVERAPATCEALRQIAAADRDLLLRWVRTHRSPSARDMSKEDAGTTLIDLMKQVGANRDVKSVNRLTDFAGSSDDPTIQNKTKLFLQSMEKTDKQMAEVIGHAINEKKVENETMRNDLLKQSSRTVSSEADLSLKYKKDGFDIGGSVKAGASGDLKKYADEQLKLLDKNEGFRQELNTNLKSGKEQSGGGETFVIGSAVVELGDAPRIYHNSLLYPAPAQGKGGGK
jgi:tetratricopeptide (TPR) repeat protein